MRLFGTMAINLLGIALAVAAGEGLARLIEPQRAVSSIPLTTSDPELAWVPRPNAHARGVSSEFDADTVTNDHGLYDFPAPADPDGERLSILALGDSHTAATGVSTGQTWPKILQQNLAKDGISAWVHNGGVHGYSLDQYLVRFRRLAPIVKPRVVIVGFSAATDFFDLGITKAGDFVYGADLGRVYFSLDGDGELAEHRDLVGKTADIPPGSPSFTLHALRGWLADNVALFRLLRRSDLAFWIAMHVRSGDESLWPGLDTALKVDLSADDRRRIDLAGKLIGRIADEVRQTNALPMLVHIPYLAQVYDSVWKQSFGSVPGYERDLASKRLEAIAARYGLLYVDAYPVMRDYVASHGGEWVHYRIDSHPDVTGQRLIGDAVFDKLQACLKQNPELKPDGCR